MVQEKHELVYRELDNRLILRNFTTWIDIGSKVQEIKLRQTSIRFRFQLEQNILWVNYVLTMYDRWKN